MILLDPDARPVIAHRGASGRYPENTLLAFERALALGADALELDVRVTADGVPVVLHDATLARTAGDPRPVAQLSAQELRRATLRRGEPVPTLREVLDRWPAVPLLVELKDPGAAGPALELLRARGAAGRVLVGAFARAALLPFRRGGWATTASRWEVAGFWAGARLGVESRGGGYRAFSVPARYGGLPVVDRAFVARARRAGLPVHVWTVDDPVEAARLRRLGVCGIITNYPERMRQL